MYKADSKLYTIDLDATSNFLKDLKTALQNSSVSKFIKCILL